MGSCTRSSPGPDYCLQAFCFDDGGLSSVLSGRLNFYFGTKVLFSTSVSTTTNQGAQMVYFAFEHTDSSFCSSSFEMLSLVILTLNQCGTKGVNLSGAYWTVRNLERSKSASKCI